MHSEKCEHSIALFGISKEERAKENIRLIWNILTYNNLFPVFCHKYAMAALLTDLI